VEIDIAVVVKMIKKTLLPLCRSREVNGQHSSAGFQNPSPFVSTLLASFAARMMKHHRGQYCPPQKLHPITDTLQFLQA